MTSPFAPSLGTLTQFARQHRKAPTRSEAMLWQALRDRRFRGLKVRRQHPLCPYIVDFFVPSLRLAIEIDGSAHDGREAEDAHRDAELLRLHGVRVVRVTAAAVEHHLGEVLRALRAGAR